jgi:hypothetical protein
MRDSESFEKRGLRKSQVSEEICTVPSSLVDRSEKEGLLQRFQEDLLTKCAWEKGRQISPEPGVLNWEITT